jgi:hypothetical protein
MAWPVLTHFSHIRRSSRAPSRRRSRCLRGMRAPLVRCILARALRTRRSGRADGEGGAERAKGGIGPREERHGQGIGSTRWKGGNGLGSPATTTTTLFYAAQPAQPAQQLQTVHCCRIRSPCIRKRVRAGWCSSPPNSQYRRPQAGRQQDGRAATGQDDCG